MKLKFVKYFFPVLIVIFLCGKSEAQFENIKFKYKNFMFQTKFDSVNYTTMLKVKREGKTIYKETFVDIITEIKSYDLDGNGKKEILLQIYSGGAHCCTSTYSGEIRNGRFILTDSINWGNSFYRIEDLKNDSKYEITGVNDMFAYAFTNYSQSRFNILIYGYENGKFKDITNQFPEIIYSDIDELRKELKTYTDAGFECPGNNEDTFNTDAGAVKAILAPIVADYYTLGKTENGYELIDSVYKCSDKEKFMEILKTDFKLK